MAFKLELILSSQRQNIKWHNQNLMHRFWYEYKSIKY